jgi:hypothetical protein
LQRLNSAGKATSVDPYAEVAHGEDWRTLALHLLDRLAALETRGGAHSITVKEEEPQIPDEEGELKYGWNCLAH